MVVPGFPGESEGVRGSSSEFSGGSGGFRCVPGFTDTRRDLIFKCF